jgi:hypothetical protein
MKILALLGALTIGCLTTVGPAAAQVKSVPSGDSIYATMQTPLDTKTANTGDHFTMNVVEPYPADIDLSGATIVGHVAKVVRAGQGTKPELDLQFDRLVYSDGSSVPLEATLSSLQSKNQAKNGAAVAAKTIGGMILGNIIGKTIFHTGGGGVVGAIGGFLYGDNEKTDIHVDQGAQAQLTLTQPLRERRQAM